MKIIIHLILISLILIHPLSLKNKKFQIKIRLLGKFYDLMII